MNATAQIFVANLAPGVTEAELRRLFGEHGTVSEINLLTNHVSGESRGMAFVAMKSHAEAQTAMNRLNGAVLAGHALVLNAAKPRRASPEVKVKPRWRWRRRRQ